MEVLLLPMLLEHGFQEFLLFQWQVWMTS
ncbi:hypothetical protein Golax_006506, partial [Gossypium laxum]|nr:hypothetical protein [Gossypium laxum]